MRKWPAVWTTRGWRGGADGKGVGVDAGEGRAAGVANRIELRSTGTTRTSARTSIGRRGALDKQFPDIGLVRERIYLFAQPPRPRSPCSLRGERRDSLGLVSQVRGAKVNRPPTFAILGWRGCGFRSASSVGSNRSRTTRAASR